MALWKVPSNDLDELSLPSFLLGFRARETWPDLSELLQSHPQFKEGTAYRQLRPTRLDKIKNLHLAGQVGAVI